MQRSELKPCPCCEGKAKYYDDIMLNGPMVYCTNCGLRVTGYNSKKEAMEAWNKRPNPWHTEPPTEEGWYVCKMKGIDLYETQYFTGVNWNEETIEKWQKIEETD